MLAVVLAGVLGGTAGCVPHLGGHSDAAPTTSAGPTLSSERPPAGWQDVRHPGGLVYSVPPGWETPAPAKAPPGGQGGQGGQGSPAAPGDDGTQDWGPGYVTGANAVAERGYCERKGNSFRLLSGITDAQPGEPKDAASSAGRALSGSLDRLFTQNGAEVEQSEPRLIGVSGTPAWYLTLHAKVREPRDTCTPPTIRLDAIAVAAKSPDGSPAAHLFLLMSDEDQPGVIPTATVDQVVASLRYDDSI